MEVAIKKLMDFFIKCGMKHPNRAIMTIEPFFRKIPYIDDNEKLIALNNKKFSEVDEWELYGLATDSKDWNFTKTTIEEATNRKVEGIHFITDNITTPKEEWMTDAVYHEIILRLLGDLKNCLVPNLGVNLSELLIEELQEELGEEMWNRVTNELNIYLLDALSETYNHILWTGLWRNHWKNIFFYVAYCFTGNLKMIQVFENLLAVLNEYIILGEKNDSSKKWVILKR